MWFGPEMQFGHLLGDHFDNQVLIIKTAWGGRDLHKDFRPPSSGGEVGPFYKEMLGTVNKVLSDVKGQFPGHTGGGYELCGFVWWHGWNDFCSPDKGTPEYEKNLTNLINDLRKDLKAPKLPVVIGEFTGPWGADCKEAAALTIRKAQKDVAEKPEFAGMAKFVVTHDFVRSEKESPTGEGYHEFKNGETYFLLGDAFGKAMISLLAPAKAPASSTSSAAPKPAKGTLTLTSPLDYQVTQRTTKTKGGIALAGSIDPAPTKATLIGARIVADGKPGVWQKLTATFKDSTFQATMEAPAGGWYRVEVRAVGEDKSVADAAVDHVGVGEVFVVAGQSNSANHGEEKQVVKTGKVVAFNGKTWQPANDPQPGASGGGGSFIPPFGEAMAQRLGVPVGIIACGIGATSVREWLPAGSTFPNPPTIEGNVTKLPTGEWESKGAVYLSFVDRLKQPGPNGFRAVLWHQGESDANQGDKSRTLAGKLYREYLEKLIVESRRGIGWDAPWFVAQVSYHVPGDEASPDIRAAQASLWKDGIALEGPDSDALKGNLRESGGKGVHFSGAGLREHAARWVEKVAPWVEKQAK
jgi:hypothetical protein